MSRLRRRYVLSRGLGSAYNVHTNVSVRIGFTQGIGVYSNRNGEVVFTSSCTFRNVVKNFEVDVIVYKGP